MGVRRQWASGVLAWIVLLALPALGQYEVGQASLSLAGTMGFGYNGDYGNLMNSSHSLSGSGTGTLSGNYYNQNFLSFAVSPYYGQSRANSNYQSVFDSSGVNASTSIFSGSHFPGSVSYAKSYNSQGTLGVPGVADYTTKGNSDSFGINWSENLPDEPSLSVGFQRGSNAYSILGTSDSGSSAFDSLTLRSAYTIQGFGLSAFYQDGGGHSTIPQLADSTQTQDEQVSSKNSGYGFSASHKLPLRGGSAVSFTHSSFGTDVGGTAINGNVDLLTGNAGIQPTDKLHLSVGANYSSSLTGQLYEQVVSAGGVAPAENLDSGSHGFDVIGSVGYAVTKRLQSEADVERREQRYLGQDYGSNAYSGSLLYTTGLWKGNINAALTVRDSTLDGSNLNALGFSTTVNYTRRINEWVMSGSFNYAQNVQTLLITYMTSLYNYSGNLRHRSGNFTWTIGAGAGRTGLTEQKGAENTNESYSAGFGYSRYINLNATYTKSSGIGVETGAGVVQNPVLVPVLTPGSAILFNGDGYSVGLGSNPIKKFTLAASYARANNRTLFNSVNQTSSNLQYNAIFQYQVRKIYLTGGYSRLQQAFNTSASGPAVISSFYIGLSRWFNFF